MAPTTWRTNTAVGVSSVKKSEAEAGISDAFARDLRIQLTGHDVAATRNDSGEQRWWGVAFGTRALKSNLHTPALSPREPLPPMHRRRIR
jgi:hypothetical protein